MTSILLVAPVPIARQRAGPAIRFWEFARILSTSHQVTLLVPNRDHPPGVGFVARTSAGADWGELLSEHQVIIVQGPALHMHPDLAPALADPSARHCLVVDLYDPITLEQLEIDRESRGKSAGGAARALHREYTALLREQLLLGDFFLCASERQRAYWLGWLAALGRINHDTYDRRDLRQLVDVVPFGLPAAPPRASAPVLKGVCPGIAATDQLILWGGGLWEWLDPLSCIRAMACVADHHPSARLVFFEAERYRSTIHSAAKQLAADLGLLNRSVLFTQWLPPEQWPPCLLEADIGLSFHPATIESYFAFRTRLLDYIWAGLPIVCADGDELSDLVASQGLGSVVEAGNVEALASALIALLAEPEARTRRTEAFRRVAQAFHWEKVTQPLVTYCAQPWPAGDRASRWDERWQAAQTDQLVARAAHAERRQAESDALAHRLQAQVDGLTRSLQQSEERFAAAMDGRVMRWMTGVQRALRGKKP
jgi:hypothetical protein